MFRFLAFILVLMAVVGFGVYYAASNWLSGVQGNYQLELVKVIPAALATAVAALIAAGASVLNVGLQLRAGKSLEQTKRQLAGELAADNKSYSEELEGLKTRLAKELDEDKQNLSHQLAIEKSEIERQLSQLSLAEETASSYRHLVGMLRFGQHDVDEIDNLLKSVGLVSDRLPAGSDLRKMWNIFRQRGHNLNEMAKKVRTLRTRREVWMTKDERTGNYLGLDFATSAAQVLELLRDERQKILAKAASR
jgi:hypothetical protein